MIIFTVTIQAKDKSELANILEDVLNFVKIPQSLEGIVSMSNMDKGGTAFTIYKTKWEIKDGE